MKNITEKLNEILNGSRKVLKNEEKEGKNRKINKGISLMILVITIIVILILASTIIMTTINGLPINKAQRTSIQSDYSTIRDKYLEEYNNILFEHGGRPNDITSEQLQNIIPEEFRDKLVATKDGISYVGDDDTEKEVAKELGFMIGRPESNVRFEYVELTSNVNDITVEVGIRSNIIGVKEYEYFISTDGKNWTSQKSTENTCKFDGLEDFTEYFVKVVVTDNNGKTVESETYSIKTKMAEFEADELRFTKGSISGEAYEEGTWSTEDIYVVIVKGEDTNTTYKATGANTVNDTKETSILTTSGVTNLTVTTVKYGKYEKTREYVVYIDKGMPEVKELTKDTNAPVKEKVVLTGKAVDNISGIVAYQFSKDENITASSSGWNVVENTKQEMMQIYEAKENGKWYFYVKDEAGNVSRKEIEVNNIDNTVPTDETPTVTSTTNTVTVKVNQTDESGIAKKEVAIRKKDGTWSDWKEITGDSYIFENLDKNTEYEVKTKVTDSAGNANESKIASVKTVELTKPSITAPTEITVGPVIVTITYPDIAGTTRWYSTNGTDWIKTTNKVQEVSVSTNNTTVYAKITDSTNQTSGNATWQVTNIDSVKPTLQSVNVTSPQTGTYGAGQEVTIVATYSEKVKGTVPTLKIKFANLGEATITSGTITNNTITYKYTIKGSDYGKLSLVSYAGKISDIPGNEQTISYTGTLGGNSITASTQSVLAESTNFRDTIPSNTTAIVFVDDVAPSGVTTTDVSAAKNGSVVAWLDGTTYKVSSQKENVQVIASANCKKLFGYSESDAGYNTRAPITSIDLTNLNINNVTDMSYLFSYYELTNLVFPENFNTSKVTTMYGMFRWNKLISLDNILTAPGFITDNVTNMYAMFWECTNLTSLDLSKFNTSKVTNMGGMFYSLSSLTSLDVSNFNTSRVTNMANMFSRCDKITSLDLKNFNTSNVTGMSYMFGNGLSLSSLDISSFNTSKVTNMEGIFCNCKKLENINLTHFNTSKVTNMYCMFEGDSKLTNINLSGWNTEKVSNMGHMFAGCQELISIDLSSFNTSKVTHMGSMFNECRKLKNLELSNFNTSNVNKMHNMFYNCSSLENLDISNFDTSNVVHKINIFWNCKKLSKVKLSDKFDFHGEVTGIVGEQNVTGNDYLPVPSNTYIPGANGNWYNVAGIAFVASAVPSNKADTYTAIPPESILKVWTENSTSDFHAESYRTKITKVKFANKINVPSGATSWDVSNTGNGSVMAYVESDGANGYVLTIAGHGKVYANQISDYLFNNFTALKSIENIKLLDVTRATSLRYMFGGCSSLTSLDITSFNTENTTNMGAMFAGCSSLTSLDVSKLNTSKVTNLNAMFMDCSGLTTLDVTTLNTTSATNMGRMFSGCSKLTSLDVTKFNTSKATNLNNIFYNCSNLTTLDVTNFDTSKVTNMSHMFDSCSKLANLDVSGFDTSSATNMLKMFAGCSSLTSLDVSDFNTAKVTTLLEMFHGCNKLTTLDVSKWDTSLVINMAGVFGECANLTSLDVSKFNTSKATDMSYMFNGCGNLTSLDVANFDVRNVTTIVGMFNNCKNVTTLDVSKWITSSLTTTKKAFRECRELVTLDVSNWDVSKVTNMQDMFFYCFELVSLDLSNWNMANVTTKGRMFEACNKLQMIKLSETFKFFGESTNEENEVVTDYLPVPNPNYISGADGKWYNASGVGYEPSVVPSNLSGTYYAISPSSIAKPTISASTDPAIEVVATITYPLGSDFIYEYSLDGTNWSVSTTFTKQITVTENNTTIYARVKKTNGQVGNVVTHTVTNIDSGAPILSTLAVTSPASGTYKAGQAVTIVATFSENITGTAPTLKIKFGNGTERTATAGTPSGNTITYTYQIASGDNGTLALTSYSGGEIKDTAGNSYTATNKTLSGNSIVADTTVPTLSSLNVTAPASGTYGYGQEVTIVATYSENISGTAPTLKIKFEIFGESTITTGTISNNTITYKYTIKGSDYGKLSLVSYSGKVQDNIGNEATIAYTSTLGGNSITASTEPVLASGIDFRNTIPATTTAIVFVDEAAPSGVTTIDVSSDKNGSVVAWLDGTTYKVSSQKRNVQIIASNSCNKLFGWSDGEEGFDSRPAITSIDLSNLNINNVTNMGYMFSYVPLTNLVFPSGFNTSNVTSMYAMFRGTKMTNVDYIIADPGFITTNVINTMGMFMECDKLESVNVSSWNTSKVTTMRSMFYGCSELKALDASNFNTSNVTDMSYMFTNCKKITSLNVSNFTTDKVTNMERMFINCYVLTSLDVSGFDTTNVENMQYMFSGCGNLTALDVSGFNTSNVTNMQYMFYDCSKISILDVSGFNTSKVTNFKAMFQGCRAVTRLDLSGFDTSSVTEMSSMFASTRKLQEVKLGNKFSFLGNGSITTTNQYLLEPSSANIPGADGKWYNTAGMGYAPSEVPNNKADTYYAISPNAIAKPTISASTAPAIEVVAVITYPAGSEYIYQYSLDGTNWSVSTTITKQITVTENNTTIYARVKKTNGQVGNVVTHTVTNIDSGAPILSTLAVTAPAAGTYKAGQAVTIVATFSENITGTVPTLKIKFGSGTERTATAGTLSGNTITYTYQVASGDNGTLTLSSYSGGNLTDIAGNIANITASITGNTIVADTTVPTLDSVNVTSPATGTYKAGQAVTIVATYSENLKDNMSTLKIKLGSGDEKIVNGTISGNKITYSYTITGADNGLLSMASYTGSVTDMAGNESILPSSITLGGNKITAYTESILKGYEYQSIEDFHASEYVTKITKAIFKSDLTVPNTASVSWDVSRAQDGSVVAYLESDGAEGYILTIGGHDKIYANNENAGKSYLFSGMTALKTVENMNLFDTSKAYYLRGLFRMCSSLTSVDISNFVTTNVTNMASMFNGCSSLTTLDVSSLNTSKVTDMHEMFSNCKKLTSLDVAHFDTGKASNMISIFYNCSNLTSLEVSSWKTSSATSLQGIFWNCSKLQSIDVSNWDTSKSTSFYHSFAECTSLTSIDLTNWNTSSVTTMGYMFTNSKNLEIIKIGNWDTSNVTHFGNMFRGCTSLKEVNLSSFDTSKAEKMYFMFADCKALESLDLSGFSMASDPLTLKMFQNCAKLASVKIGENFVFKGSQTTIISDVEQTGDGYLPTPKSSYIAGATGKWYNGAGVAYEPNAIPSNKADTYTVFHPDSVMQGWGDNATTDFHAEEYRTKITKIKFTDNINVPSGVTSWDVSETGNGSVMAYVESDGASGYVLTIGGYGKIYANEHSDYMLCNFKSLVSIENIKILDTSRVKSMHKMFSDCTSLTELDVTNFDTSNVEYMGYMFNNCTSLTELDVTKFNTSNVTSMAYMFAKCKKLTSLAVSGFDTSKVTNFQVMFDGCSSLTSLDVSGFDTGNATLMNNMFCDCKKLSNIEVGDFDVSKVTNLYGMFMGCIELKSLDVEDWNTEKVQNMGHLFDGCKKLSDIDLSKWNTNNLQQTHFLFYNCDSLIDIDISNFITPKLTSTYGMFENCDSLTKLDISNLDMTNVTNSINMFTKTIKLQQVKLGNKFKFIGTMTGKVSGNEQTGDDYLPIPSSSYITGADGKWYNTAGIGYVPSEVPSNVADTYYAKSPASLAPTISAPTRWVNSSTGVTVTITYPSSSEITKQYSTNGTTWETTNNVSQTVKVTTNNTTVYARVIDSTGQSSTTATWQITCIDDSVPTAPTTMEFIYEDGSRYTQGDWSSSSIYAGYSTGAPEPSGATDTGSGVAKYQISTDNSNWEDFVYNSSDSMYCMSTDGTHTRYFRAVDYAGNAGPSISRTAKIDKSGPILMVSNATDGAAYTGGWTNKTVTSVITFSDNETGVNASSLQRSEDGSTWTTIANTSTSTYTDTWSSERNGKVYYKIADNNGNYSSISFDVKIDKTVPTAAFTSISGATLTLSYSDTNGVTEYYYGSSATPSYTTMTSKTSGTLTPTLSDAASPYYFSVKDAAGNVTTVSKKIYKITYDTDGGSAAPSAQYKLDGIALTLSGTTPTKTGCVFKGWGTTKGATSATWGVSGSYTVNESKTLYAQWAKLLAYQVSVGDYVNYPVNYSNVATSSDGGYIPKTNYTGWRVLAIEGSGDNKYVRLVSAGIPLTYVHPKTATSGPTSVKALTTNFFSTPISSTSTNYNFRKCGFKNASGTTITTIAQLKTLFINDYTQISSNVPKVQSMTKADFDLVYGSESPNGTYVTSNDLLAIPSQTSGRYAAYHLATYNTYSSYHYLWNVRYEGAIIFTDSEHGIRPVVTLKSTVETSGQSNSIWQLK